MNGSVYDPNFEFNAPKFHDFTNPADDDENADTWFDGKPEQAEGDDLASDAPKTSKKGARTPGKTPTKTPRRKSSRISGVVPHEGQPAEEDAAPVVAAEGPSSTSYPVEEAPKACSAKKLIKGQENEAAQKKAAPAAGAGRKSNASWRKSTSEIRVDSKLTQSIMALAGFKETETEVMAVAGSSVADAALAGTPSKIKAKAAAAPADKEASKMETCTTARNHLRTSNASTAHSRLFQSTAASAQKSRRHSSSILDGVESESSVTSIGKRGRVSTSNTPSRPSAKKLRPSIADPSCTPTFSRFNSTARGSSRPMTAPPSREPPSSSKTPRAAWSVTKAPRSARKSTVPTSPKLSTSRSCSRPGRQGAERRESTSSAQSSASAKSSGPASLTVPVSPRLSGRSRVRKSAVDSDARQLQEAEQAMEQMRKRRKVGEAKLRGVLEPKGEVAMTARSTRSLTVPKSPSLRTNTRGDVSRESIGSLSDGEGYVSLTDRLKKFSATPTRFKKKEGAAPRSAAKPAHLTNPKTPDFSKFKRKSTAVKSAIEKEEEEVKEMKARMFKARPLSHRVLESCGDLGVPKVEKKALTNPEGPKFLSEARASLRSRESSRESLDGVSFEFKARPVPKERRHGVRPANARESRKLTIPTSPKLHSQMRSRSVTPSASQDDLSTSFKAVPMPNFSKAFVPRHDHTKLTQPEAFKLRSDARGAEKEKEFQKACEQLRRAEEEARKYKANPIRHSFDSNTSSTHSYEPKPLTETKPFNLRSDSRHEFSRAQFEDKVTRSMEEEDARFSSFRAAPIPKAVSDREKVFTPRRSMQPLTEVQNFEFASDRRTRQREQFDMRMAEKQAADDARRRDEEQRRKEEEERETKNMRKSLVIKAKPIPGTVYQPNFEVQRSTKPLTEPSSPSFRMDARLRSTVAR